MPGTAEGGRLSRDRRQLQAGSDASADKPGTLGFRNCRKRSSASCAVIIVSREQHRRLHGTGRQCGNAEIRVPILPFRRQKGTSTAGGEATGRGFDRRFRLPGAKWMGWPVALPALPSGRKAAARAEKRRTSLAAGLRRRRETTDRIMSKPISLCHQTKVR